MIPPFFLMKLLCFALFACAFNLLAGYAGLISFGHAALFGGAGYLTGLALTAWGWPTPLGILTGVATALLIGLVMGLLAVRRSGIYFSMITLALAQIVWRNFAQGGSPLVGGLSAVLFALAVVVLADVSVRAARHSARA